MARIGRQMGRRTEIDSVEATSQVRACSHLVTTARVHAPLLASGLLT